VVGEKVSTADCATIKIRAPRPPWTPGETVAKEYKLVIHSGGKKEMVKEQYLTRGETRTREKRRLRMKRRGRRQSSRLQLTAIKEGPSGTSVSGRNQKNASLHRGRGGPRHAKKKSLANGEGCRINLFLKKEMSQGKARVDNKGTRWANDRNCHTNEGTGK